MKYIIVISYRDITQYIGQGTYRYGGEKYAVLTDETRAKRYSSRARAENALARLLESCVNIGLATDVCEVEEVEA